MLDFAPQLAALLVVFVAAASRGEAIAAIIVFGTGIVVGALLIVIADAYARRKHGG